MSYVQHRCPNCGAALPPPPPAGVVRCSFCATPLAAAAGAWRPSAPAAEDEPLRDPDRPRLWVEGARYAVLGRLAQGETSDVFLARRDSRVTELVVLKMLRTAADADVLAREWRAIEALQESTAPGAPHFTRLLPQPVRHGVARLGPRGLDGERPVTVLRWRSGYVHTFDDVAAAHPAGVAPEASVWLWKRILEQLGWVHRSGWAHGTVLPAHLLVHARDHGVMLVGWSRAVPLVPPLAAADIAMSARCVLRLAGGGVPEPIKRLLERPPEPAGAHDAWAIRDRLDEAAREAFGAPKYVPFPMPGWK